MWICRTRFFTGSEKEDRDAFSVKRNDHRVTPILIMASQSKNPPNSTNGNLSRLNSCLRIFLYPMINSDMPIIEGAISRTRLFHNES